MKKIAILQSNYIPWKGYFDLIASVDEFVLYDDMQYTRRDWRNRNMIKTPKGPQWISVPVQVKGKFEQKIRDTKIDGSKWLEQHWKTIELNYSRSEYYKDISTWLKPLYTNRTYVHLSELNRTFIEAICSYLSIQTKISNSWDYEISGEKSEKLLNICLQANASTYVSGPAAKSYLNENIFNDANVIVEWYDYSNYPHYPQLWGEFEHSVSILDLLFNCNGNSHHYMKHSPQL